MKPWLATLVWPTAALVASCSIDERTLELGSAHAGDGGAPQGGEPASSSAGSESVDVGGAGAGGLIDGCADLDTDRVADCEVTLLQNATFGDDVSGWAAEGGASLTWAEPNALGDAPSGSGKLHAASTRVAAAQCVPVAGERLVIAYANAFIEPASGTEGTRALLEVSFFEQAACSGERERFFETPPASEAGAWVTIHAGGLSKPSTRSLSLALVGARTLTAGELDVYFDNVLLKTEVVPPPPP